MIALYVIAALFILSKLFVFAVDMYLWVTMNRAVRKATRFKQYYDIAHLPEDAEDAIRHWREASRIAFILNKETLADWYYEQSTKVAPVRDYELERIERLIK
jgi:hypothetical protein